MLKAAALVNASNRHLEEPVLQADAHAINGAVEGEAWKHGYSRWVATKLWMSTAIAARSFSARYRTLLSFLADRAS